MSWQQSVASSLGGKMILSPTGPNDEEITTPTDRRWLWWLASALEVRATTDELRELHQELSRYLRETCEHHFSWGWGVYYDDDTDEYRQCLWCNYVEMRPR